MKKLLITTILTLSLTSCSIFFSPDKNEAQPKLAGAQRSPVNTELQAAQQQYAAQQMAKNNPQFIDNQPSAVANTMGMMDINAAPVQPQAEVFMNQNVAIGTAPAAIPGNEPIPQVQDVQPKQVAAPAPAAPQPAPLPSFNYLPVQSAPADPNAVTVGTSRKLPASLRADYNNPLNYAPLPLAPQPMAMPMMGNMPMQPMMMQQPMMGQPMVQPVMPPMAMPMGQPMLQPVYTPTQPVDQMQMYTQPIQPMR